ncbi:MAG TPA: DUF2190 family protein [Gammaproteobacteria bacterium]|nr:DUF2190 family protein [Gammaproteobacteria bacterium]
MATNYIQPGEVMDYTASADISSGDVVVVGARVGVALNDIANGETGPVQVSGVFELPKDTAVALSQGALAYWDATAGNIDDTNTNPYAGYVFEDAAAADATVKIKLNG